MIQDGEKNIIKAFTFKPFQDYLIMKSLGVLKRSSSIAFETGIIIN